MFDGVSGAMKEAAPGSDNAATASEPPALIVERALKGGTYPQPKAQKNAATVAVQSTPRRPRPVGSTRSQAATPRRIDTPASLTSVESPQFFTPNQSFMDTPTLARAAVSPSGRLLLASSSGPGSLADLGPLAQRHLSAATFLAEKASDLLQHAQGAAADAAQAAQSAKARVGTATSELRARTDALGNGMRQGSLTTREKIEMMAQIGYLRSRLASSRALLKSRRRAARQSDLRQSLAQQHARCAARLRVQAEVVHSTMSQHLREQADRTGRVAAGLEAAVAALRAKIASTSAALRTAREAAAKQEADIQSHAAAMRALRAEHASELDKVARAHRAEIERLSISEQTAARAGLAAAHEAHTAELKRALARHEATLLALRAGQAAALRQVSLDHEASKAALVAAHEDAERALRAKLRSERAEADDAARKLVKEHRDRVESLLADQLVVKRKAFRAEADAAGRDAELAKARAEIQRRAANAAATARDAKAAAQAATERADAAETRARKLEAELTEREREAEAAKRKLASITERLVEAAASVRSRLANAVAPFESKADAAAATAHVAGLARTFFLEVDAGAGAASESGPLVPRARSVAAELDALVSASIEDAAALESRAERAEEESARARAQAEAEARRVRLLTRALAQLMDTNAEYKAMAAAEVSRARRSPMLPTTTRAGRGGPSYPTSFAESVGTVPSSAPPVGHSQASSAAGSSLAGGFPSRRTSRGSLTGSFRLPSAAPSQNASPVALPSAAPSPASALASPAPAASASTPPPARADLLDRLGERISNLCSLPTATAITTKPHAPLSTAADDSYVPTRRARSAQPKRRARARSRGALSMPPRRASVVVADAPDAESADGGVTTANTAVATREKWSRGDALWVWSGDTQEWLQGMVVASESKRGEGLRVAYGDKGVNARIPRESARLHPFGDAPPSLPPDEEALMRPIKRLASALRAARADSGAQTLERELLRNLELLVTAQEGRIRDLQRKTREQQGQISTLAGLVDAQPHRRPSGRLLFDGPGQPTPSGGAVSTTVKGGAQSESKRKSLDVLSLNALATPPPIARSSVQQRKPTPRYGRARKRGQQGLKTAGSASQETIRASEQEDSDVGTRSDAEAAPRV